MQTRTSRQLKPEQAHTTHTHKQTDRRTDTRCSQCKSHTQFHLRALLKTLHGFKLHSRSRGKCSWQVVYCYSTTTTTTTNSACSSERRTFSLNSAAAYGGANATGRRTSTRLMRERESARAIITFTYICAQCEPAARATGNCCCCCCRSLFSLNLAQKFSLLLEGGFKIATS